LLYQLSYDPVSLMESPGFEPGTDVVPAAFAPRTEVTRVARLELRPHLMEPPGFEPALRTM